MRLLLSFVLACSSPALADAVTDWNAIGCEAVESMNLHPPAANQALAVAHTAMFEAANAITHRYPSGGYGLEAPATADVSAAVATAAYDVLMKLVPARAAALDAAYTGALAKIPDGLPKSEGIAVGRRAATAVVAAHALPDGGAPDDYRPYTSPGVYVPTVIPFATQWPRQRPWRLERADQFRPGAPPELTSEVWARDYEEVRTLGAKSGSMRTEEQTRIAKFWEAIGPSIYHRAVRSVAERPGRDVTRNARLFALVTQGSTDALIAVFEAKYHYDFWRPITAIRNGDIDGNDATGRDATWLPFIDTPMHPEYPCAHCIVSATVGTILQADLHGEAVPVLTSSSPTAGGASRSWTSIEAFEREVAEARILDGVHYRNSTEVGTAMGRKVGAWVVDAFAKDSPPRIPKAP